ncbi:alpha-amylase/4-alpha-glucanotransferase domain-containing protein [Thermopirellula anaerolimosa]
MTPTAHLVLLLHNHQPIGNFDHVFRQAYEDSYRPFLEVFARYPDIKISLHTSGPLMEWLDQNQPGYLDWVASLVRDGRIEIIGGPFYEPILAMIPSADRVGQIRRYTKWLRDRLGAEVRGMWFPERVWEQSFTRDVVDAGIEYAILDDYHFKAAGLRDEDLDGYYLTEDEGRLMAVFPGSERLRYTIPFADPQATIDHVRALAERRPGAVVVFGDDGEKFGTWPETKKHVYHDRWLERFFEALSANADWLRVSTLGEVYERISPRGKIYLPDCSYREMTEWALPTARQEELESVRHEMEHDPRWDRIRSFLRGGFWRNFRVKYREADEMYARMMNVSRRLQSALQGDAANPDLREAQLHLYRGQCNCPYWHGAFGGIYLPHLRNAIYHHLIAADTILEKWSRQGDVWIDARAEDYNFDGKPEIRVANDQLAAFIAPHEGGMMYELDVREIRLNLGAGMMRRPEAYHRKVLQGEHRGDSGCASIHERVVFKQANLDRHVRYDPYPRKSLVDLFYNPDTTPEAAESGEAVLVGDFHAAPYEAAIHANPDRVRVMMTRQGTAGGQSIRLTKAVLLSEGSSVLEIAYRLENLPPHFACQFAVEFNFAGLPGGADDRYFVDPFGKRLGHLGARVNLPETAGLGLIDQWQGIDLRLLISVPGGIRAFPIETVSQSEGGFELVHQSVAVQPYWLVRPDENGQWSVTMRLVADTTAARERRIASRELVHV